VSGTTDLPEGAVVVCYLADDQGTVGNSPEAKVTSGRFAVDLAVPTATVPLEADCRFGTAWAVQPKNVIDALGSRGERMTGPQVFRTGLTTPKELFASVPLGSIDGGGWPASSPAVSPGSS
jgi:hypothetical protein